MINYIIINGTNSNTINGLGINELPPISKPPLRVQTEEIDGRDGDISTNLGYGAYDKTISIGLFGTGYDINEVISFFNGEGTVVFSNEPNKYYKYKIINQIDYEALLKFKSATITFHCQPFKYPLEETPLEIEYEYIEQEGVESATMNNTNGGTSLKIDLKGNTSQPTTTGINEFSSDTSIWVGSSAGKVNYDSSTDVFTFHRDSGVDYLLGNGKLGLKANTRYTIYVDVLENTMTSNFNVVEGSSNLPFLLLIGANTTGKYVVSTITGSLEKNYDLWIYCNSTGTLKAKIMLVEGEYTSETIPNYEKFTYGASPNPDYPQPINVVSGDNEVVVCGKNRFDKSKYQNLITIHESTINGYCIKSIQLQPNTQYTISQSAGTTSSVVLLMNNVSNVNATNYLDCRKTSDTKTYTTDSTGKLYIGCLYNVNDTQYNERLNECNIQIEKGNEATTYMPYQSQTYPINLGTLELCKIGDYQDYFTKNSGKNLFDINAFETQLVSGKILDDNGNEVNDSTSTYSRYKIFLKANETIHIEGWFQRVYYYDENGSFKSRSASGGTSKMSTTYTPTTNEYIGFQIKNEIWASNKGQEMINLGTTATTYEPYGTGQWCKYNAIGKVVLDGSESYSEYSSGDTSNYYSYYMTINNITSLTNVAYRTLYSNNYSETTWYNISTTKTDSPNIALRGTHSRIYFRTSQSTKELFQEWLSTHNTIVYYVLATPYLSLIEDETLKSQLDNIQNAMSYEGTTNIGQVNNDKPFLLDLIAMEKGTDEVVINNIGNVYAKPTIALEGTGETDIYLNNTEILKVDLSEKNKITIDTNNMEAYDPTDNLLANRKVIGNYNSMTLPSGNTTMKITGALDKATITNYTRWL